MQTKEQRLAVLAERLYQRSKEERERYEARLQKDAGRRLSSQTARVSRFRHRLRPS